MKCSHNLEQFENRNNFVIGGNVPGHTNTQQINGLGEFVIQHFHIKKIQIQWQSSNKVVRAAKTNTAVHE